MTTIIFVNSTDTYKLQVSSNHFLVDIANVNTIINLSDFPEEKQENIISTINFIHQKQFLHYDIADIIKIINGIFYLQLVDIVGGVDLLKTRPSSS